MYPFNYAAVARSGTVGTRKPINHASCVISVIATYRNYPVRNYCVISLCDLLNDDFA